MVTYECQNCGKAFEAESWAKRKYCGPKCTYEAHRGRGNPAWKGKIERACDSCGETFSTWPSRIKAGMGKYCSLSCAAKARTRKRNPNWKGGKQLVTCEECGEEFEVPPQVFDDPDRGRFCSRDCANRWIGKSRTPGQRKRISLVCEICGREFGVPPCRASTRRVCSKECAAKLKAQQMRGPGNHFWEDGRTKDPYPAEFNERFKKSIRERDGFRCALCGAPGNAVHHIDHEKSNTVPENCITLCAKCHGRIHGRGNRGQEIDLLRSILQSNLEGDNVL